MLVNYFDERKKILSMGVNKNLGRFKTCFKVLSLVCENEQEWFNES